MKKINYTDELRQAWSDNELSRDTLVAQTAMAAVQADSEITAKAFVESTREAGFQAAGAVFQAALRTAKEAGATETGIAAAAKAARDKLAADSREKRRIAKEEAAKKAAAKAEADELAAKAALNPALASDLAERNLVGEVDRLAGVDQEIMRLTLEAAKSRRLLADADMGPTATLTLWTKAGLDYLADPPDALVPLAAAEIKAAADMAAATAKATGKAAAKAAAEAEATGKAAAEAKAKAVAAAKADLTADEAGFRAAADLAKAEIKAADEARTTGKAAAEAKAKAKAAAELAARLKVIAGSLEARRACLVSN